MMMKKFPFRYTDTDIDRCMNVIRSAEMFEVPCDMIEVDAPIIQWELLAEPTGDIEEKK